MNKSDVQSETSASSTGRPPEVTEEQVIAAGEALVAAGQTPTATALRRQIGSGRPDRLKSVWEQHVEAEAQRKARSNELPEPLKEHKAKAFEQFATAFEDLVYASYRHATEEATARTSAQRQEAERIRTEAQTELTDAYQLIEDLQHQLDAAQQDTQSNQARADHELQLRHAAEQRAAALEATNAELRSVNADLKKDADTLRQQQADLKAAYRNLKSRSERPSKPDKARQKTAQNNATRR